MYRLFPEMSPPDYGLDELFAEALRRADAEFGAMPGIAGTPSGPAHSGLFDSLLCSMVVWAVIEGRSVQAPAWPHRRLA